MNEYPLIMYPLIMDAYLKYKESTHAEREFMTQCLKSLNNAQNSDDITKVKAEMRQAFDKGILPPDYWSIASDLCLMACNALWWKQRYRDK